MSDDKKQSNDNDLLSNPREHDHLGQYASRATDEKQSTVTDWDDYGCMWCRSTDDLWFSRSLSDWGDGESMHYICSACGRPQLSAEELASMYDCNYRQWEHLRQVDIDDIVPEPPFATLHFYRGDPDSMRRLNRCLKSDEVLDEVLWAVQEFDNWLRSKVKHLEREDWPNARDIREKLYECFAARGVDLWEE